jgi:signal transduction histidine kinase
LDDIAAAGARYRGTAMASPAGSSTANRGLPGASASVLRLPANVGDALLVAVLALALEAQIVMTHPEGSLALNVVSGIVLTVPLLWRRRAPLAMLAVFGATAIANEALGGALFTSTEGDARSANPPLFAALATGIAVFYSIGDHAEDRQARIGLLAGIACLWTMVLAADQTTLESVVWSGGLLAATPWFAGRAARGRRLRIAALEREREQQARIAVSDERARIARELHDIVAHSVGVIAVQAQGAQSVLDRDPQQAVEALEAIQRTARTALGDMRHSLVALREGRGETPLAPEPTVDDLDALIAQARASGLEVELAIEGERRPLPQSLELSTYRIVQEAVTNTIKHAGGARSRVTIRYGERELEIAVDDDGPGPPVGPRDGPPGHGLIGMRERVAALGGDLYTGAGSGGGFVVHATLPLDQ